MDDEITFHLQNWKSHLMRELFAREALIKDVQFAIHLYGDSVGVSP